MTYIQGLPEQTRLFVYAFGFGFLLGICYDVFRIIRLALHLKKSMIFVQDLLYVLLCTILTFFCLLALNNGQITPFMLFGELLGWLVYYFSLGVVAIRVSNAVIRAIRKLTHRCAALFSRPFRAISARAKQSGRVLNKKIKTNYYKIIKKSKYGLKKQRALLYTEAEAVSPSAEGKKRKKERGRNQRRKKSKKT